MSEKAIYRPVPRTRLYDNVISQIRELIVSQRLQPGSPLPSERKLAKLFEVSRPIVREALRTLERDGLVQVKPGSGAFVVEPTTATIKA